MVGMQDTGGKDLSSEEEGHTYAEAGVDIEAEQRAIAALTRWLGKTFEFRREEVLDVGGHYAGIYRLGDGRVLSISTDGVGSKLMIARMMSKFDTVGIDLVGMLANDIVSVGSTPVAMVDYIAVERSDPTLLQEVGKGLYEGCRQAGMVVLGGETATLPEIVRDFDLAGTVVGLCGEDDLVLGSEIQEGDAVVGLASSGLHSNGYTLARKVFFTWNSYSPHDPLPTDTSRTIGESLLVPTRIYVRTVLDVLKEVRPHGLAHITGGGLTNLRRLKRGIGYSLEEWFAIDPVFVAIQRLGNVNWREMYRTFNMGVGFVIVVDPADAQSVLDICRTAGQEARVLGSTFEDPDQRIIVKKPHRIVL